MSEKYHDPAEYIRGIQQILVSDKKRIGFLFGAGSSLAQKKGKTSLTVPAIGKMTTDIVDEISAKKAEHKKALEEIKVELDNAYNIETILSNLEQKSKLLSGVNKLNGLSESDFLELIKLVKECVRKKVSVHKDSTGAPVSLETIDDLVQTDFANWIGQAERKFPIEIFTTNYDFLFELGLEQKEIPYYDGFCGSYRPFFNSESVENLSFLSNQTKVWKIHGSLGWHYDDKTEKILRKNPDDEDILIYPSSLKYKDSKKQPYESLMDRLSNFIKQDDTILITCGYSWGDEHINERIISALKTNTSSHVIGLIFDKYKDAAGDIKYLLNEDTSLSKVGLNNPKISLYGYRHAIIGCKKRQWKLKSEPDIDDTVQVNMYYDEDAPEIDQDTGDPIWTGLGEFILPDFSRLVNFLDQMIADNEIKTIGKDAK
ncbi:SIR2 family protein [Reichenbachiella sp.]|uniref:SIR2 family protein n=1 Tax=Reichenbachiella sp. TaxID=2184521 RepID=UPI00329A36BF